MKKSWSNSYLWMIVVIVGLALGGCGGGQKVKDAGSLKIGAIVPLSGNDAVLGDFTLKGLQLAVDEQNAKGGLSGRKIELDIQDSKGDPKEGEVLIRKMMEQEVKPFMVYAIVSGVAQAIKPETEANNVILMAAVGTNLFLEDSKFTVRNYISAESIGREVSHYLKEMLNVSGLTLFYSDNTYGTSVKIAIVKALTDNKMNVIAQPFGEDPSGYPDLISAGIDKNTECVFITGIGKSLGLLLTKIRDSGYTGPVISDQFITYPDAVQAAGENMKGVTYLDFAFDTNSPDSTIQAFVKGFENKFSKTPQNFSVITYDGAKLLFSLAEKAGSVHAEQLIQQMDSVQNFGGVFGPVTVSGRNLDFRTIFKTWN